MVALAVAALLSFDLPDTSGLRHTQAEVASTRATVFVFLAQGCPLSARYAPVLDRMQTDYSSRGVRIFGVAATTVDGYSFPLLVDPKLTLARQTAARITPEAVIVTPAFQVVYRGRIDDRALSLTQRRPKPTRNDLQSALDELLAGKPVTVARTNAVGCSIPYPAPQQSQAVTFSKQIAPILFRHCAGCHRPGQSGPFPLLSYPDAAGRAATIAAVTAARAMPPWKAEPQLHRFEGERRLSTTEIALIARWAANGAPEGNAADLPPVPLAPEDWPLGKPDLLAEMPRAFDVPADAEDEYRCFVVPTSESRDRWVRAMDFHPGNRAVVHHSLVFADTSGEARRRAAADGSYPCFGIPGFLPSASFGGWSPGMTALPYPEGAAFRLSRNADLVLQIHYHATGKAETDRSSVALYFTDTAPARRLMDVALGSRRMDIPAGEANYRITDHFTLPVDVWLTGVIPHAHYVCRRMRGWAILPGGSRVPLITIPDWDFKWQHQYRYVKPIRLPAETRLEMEFVYDNTAANPRNPNAPPQRVTWGPGSTDEMAGLHYQVMPVRNEDGPELGQALWGKLMRELGGGVFRMPVPE